MSEIAGNEAGEQYIIQARSLITCMLTHIKLYKNKRGTLYPQSEKMILGVNMMRVDIFLAIYSQ